MFNLLVIELVNYLLFLFSLKLFLDLDKIAIISIDSFVKAFVSSLLLIPDSDNNSSQNTHSSASSTQIESLAKNSLSDLALHTAL